MTCGTVWRAAQVPELCANKQPADSTKSATQALNDTGSFLSDLTFIGPPSPVRSRTPPGTERRLYTADLGRGRAAPPRSMSGRGNLPQPGMSIIAPCAPLSSRAHSNGIDRHPRHTARAGEFQPFSVLNVSTFAL